VLSSKVSTGLKAQRKSVKSVKATGAVAMLGDKQKAAAIALAAAVAVAAPAFPAKADLTSDLLARTEANKELNDKKRALTSSANFERSRTVTDGVCEFPKNFLGCEIASSKGGVAFLSDDKDIECEGTRDGKVCASKAPGSFPPRVRHVSVSDESFFATDDVDEVRSRRRDASTRRSFRGRDTAHSQRHPDGRRLVPVE
jgi:photosystem I subunit PsaN